MAVLSLVAFGFVCGCATEAHRRGEDAAAVQKEAAREIRRICALPEGERTAELERINRESGIVVQCGKD